MHHADELRLLSDDDLLVRCIILKRAEREDRWSGHLDRGLMWAWIECCRRERADIYEAALEAVRQEEAAHRAANATAWRALRGHHEQRLPVS